MDYFQSILMVLAGLGMLVTAIFLGFIRSGEPVQTFLVYLSVFFVVILVIAYFIVAFALIILGLIGMF